MTKKRRIPAGKLPEDARRRGRSRENEVLAQLLGKGQAPLDWVMRRYPDLSRDHAEALIRRCWAAREEGYALLATALRGDGGAIQALGRLSEAHPWIDLRNLDEINRQGLLLAR